MAARTARRVNSGTNRINRSVAGTVSVPGKVVTNRRAATAVPKTRTARNRSITANLNRGYMLFLMLVCAATVFMCVQFLQLKSTVRIQQNQNERLESQLVTAKAENDALYESVMNSVDLAQVRRRAVTRYGMHYATKDQIIWYNADNSGYVRQIEGVPAR